MVHTHRKKSVTSLPFYILTRSGRVVGPSLVGDIILTNLL